MSERKNITSPVGPSGLSAVDPPTLQRAVLVLRALHHELRQRIIDLLRERGSLNVTDIFVALRVEQSVASQHLAVLRKAAIVIRERKGKFIHYAVDEERLRYINELVAKLAV